MRPHVVVSLMSLLAAPLSTAGCTLLVLQDLQRGACEGVGDCPAGTACEAGECATVNPAAGLPPAGGTIDRTGGVVDGPDGVTVELPEDATSSAITVTIERASSTLIPVGIVERSRFYRVDPAVALDEPAIVSLPLAGAPCPACTLWRADDDDDEPWIELDAAAAETGFVAGELDALGAVVVAGEVAP